MRERIHKNTSYGETGIVRAIFQRAPAALPDSNKNTDRQAAIEPYRRVRDLGQCASMPVLQRKFVRKFVPNSEFARECL
jgi:hypothetical protein